QQVFVDTSRARGNQMAVLIVTKQNDPIVYGIGPLAIRQKFFGLLAERTKKIRDDTVPPADENHFSLLRCTQVGRQMVGLITAKTRIDWQFCRLRDRLDCQTGPVALL